MIDVLNKVVNLTDEDLKKYVRERILYLEEKVKDEDFISVLGAGLDYNPTNFDFFGDCKCNFEQCDIYCEYVPRDTKIVFGSCVYENGIASNRGKYYYLDVDDYILLFCKIIKAAEIEDEYQLIAYILPFLRNYFGYFSEYDRDTMFSMIARDDLFYFDPVEEHKFSKFRGRGNAECVEYTVAAHNILHFFNIDSTIVFGKYQLGDDMSHSDSAFGHAFNMVNIDGQDILVDFSSSMTVFNFERDRIDLYPYNCDVNLTDDEYDLFFNGEKKLFFDDACYILFDKDIMRVPLLKKRKYWVSPIGEEKKKVLIM